MLVHFNRARNLKRYHKIVTVLARHGFGSILANLQVDRYLPLTPAVLKQKARPGNLTPAEHFRAALEELGPTFIKLGQILSTRPDVFPPEFINELSKLRDQAPVTPWSQIEGFLSEEYGRNPAELFACIDPEPVGSASLAQVHAARLHDGREVVLKVQRPGITRTIEADLEILTDLAGLAQRTTWGQLYNPVEIVSHFAFTLHNELDYQREGVNADRFRASFERERHLYIPKVYWDYCTQRVLVLERLFGIKIDDLAALDAAGIDRSQIARFAAGIIVKEIMSDGFFHADPHPGNFVVMSAWPENGATPNGAGPADGPVIGAMDFGMVGNLSKSDRIYLVQAYNLATRHEARSLAEHMLRIGAVAGQVDLQSLERDIDRLLNQYRGLPLKYIQPLRIVEEFMQVAFRFQVHLPPDLWLLIKTTAMMDGMVRQLDPEFNLFEVLDPHVRRVYAELHMPWVWGPGFVEDLEGLALAFKDIPGMGEGLLRSLQRGELPFTVKMGATKETLDRLDRVATRLSLSVLAAAFILGPALLVPVAAGNRVATILVAVGFVVALGLGLWLAISILRAGR